MHSVKGWWCPDYDIGDLQKNISEDFPVSGKASYQGVFFEAAMAHVNEFRHAVDIGAHIGLWSHMMASKFAKVTAFEPVPEHAQCFRANITDERVTLRQRALGNSIGNVEMTLKAPVSLKARVKSIEKTEGFPVVMSTLDAENVDEPIDFIKIDCEGYELFVLQGGEETIRRNKPLMFVEQKPGNISRYGLKTEAIDLLRSWGAVEKFEMQGDWCLGWDA